LKILEVQISNIVAPCWFDCLWNW